MNRDDIIRFGEQADEAADRKIKMRGEYHPDWHQVRDEAFAALVAAKVNETYSPIGTVAGGAGERTFVHPSVKFILPTGLQLYARIEVREEDKV